MKLFFIIALLALATSARGQYILDVVLRENPTNIISMPLAVGQKAARDFDGFIDYPLRFSEDGTVTASKKMGTGAAISVTRFAVAGSNATIALTVKKSLVIGTSNIMVGTNPVPLPVLEVTSTDIPASLRLGEWLLVGDSPATGKAVWQVAKDRHALRNADCFRIRKKE